MKLLKTILPLALLLLASTACNKKLFGVKGKGANVTEVRSLTGFNKITLDIDADVTYEQSTDFYVEISAQENILEVLRTEISAGELKIDFRKWVRKHSNISIVIHSPEIKGIKISGSGNVNVPTAITTTDMELHISGSGNLTLYSLTSSDLEAKISGSGNLALLNGTVNNQTATISGSGDIDMEDCQANNSSCKISGSGSITVHAIQELDATISGSGDIRYRGNPAVNANISGSGSVIHI